MNEAEINQRKQHVERVVVDLEEKMFEEFELLREKWEIAEGAMVELVRATDADLADNYFDWLEG